MDIQKDEINKTLEEFMKRVRKLINVKKFIMFGSRARGDNTSNSDLDLLIISPDFKNIKFFKRAAPFHLLWEYPLEIDIICLTPEEMSQKKKEIGSIQQAIKEGIELHLKGLTQNKIP